MLKVNFIIVFFINFISILPLDGFSQTFQLVACGENYQPISYAHIQNMSNSEMVLSNTDGSFILKYFTDSDIIKVSHIGYQSVQFKISELLKSKSICLERQDFELAEFLVGSMNEFDFLQRGIQNTEAKFQKPSKVEAYYKEFVSSNGEHSHFSDGAITYFIQKSGEKLKIEGDVKESRAVVLPRTEKLDFDLISPIGYKEGLKYYFPSDIKKFMSTDAYKNYSYEIAETDDEWIVQAKPLVDSEAVSIGYASFFKSDTTLSRVSIKIPKDRLHLLKQVSLLGYNIKIDGFDLDIVYSKTESGFIYPALIRMDHQVNLSNKKDLNQSNSFVSDLQITKLLIDQNPIPKTNQYNKKSLYKRGTNFKTEYWKNKSVVNLTQKELEIIEKIMN